MCYFIIPREGKNNSSWEIKKYSESQTFKVWRIIIYFSYELRKF